MSPARGRRGRGEGTIEERGKNTWRIRVYNGTDPISGHPRQASRTVHGSRKTAVLEMQRLATEVAEGKHASSTGSVGRLLTDWLADLERLGKRPSTIQSYELITRRHLAPALGVIPLRKLSAHDLDTYYRAKADTLAPNTIRLHHAILSGALAQGVKWGWLTSNPAQSASPPKATETNRHAPTTADVRRLLVEAGDDIDLKTAVLLAVITGGRRGELCGLKWGDVNWQAGELRIERQRSPSPGGDRTGPTKSDKPRTVAIGALGVAALRAYRFELGARAVALGLESIPVDGWLLSADCGWTPTQARALTRNVTELGKRAGVPLTLHETRHYAATQMIGGGTDVTTAAGRLGHTPEMLLRVYAHRIPERDRAAAEMLELGVLGEIVALPSVSQVNGE